MPESSPDSFTLSVLWENPYLLSSLLYLLALVGVGVYKAKSVKDSEDFMVAGRTLPWYILVGTLLATWIGSGSLFSGAGLGYRNGLAGLWSSGGAWLGIILVFFIAKRIRNFGKVTIPDIFQARYGSPAAILATITTVIAYLTIVSYQFKGGGKVLSIVTEGAVSPELGIIVTAVFAITYTVLAGMFSVVYTDVVNGVLMTFGTLGALFWIVNAVGGAEEVYLAAEAAGKWSMWGNWAAERTSGISGPVLAMSFFVPTMLLLLGDANVYQRIFSARDGGSARKAVFFWVIGVFVLETAVGFLGLAGSVAAEKGVIAPIVQEAEDGKIEELRNDRRRAGEVLDSSFDEQIAAAIALLDGPHRSDFSASGEGAEVKEAALAIQKARKSGTEGVIPAIALSLPLLLGMLLVATMMAIIVSTADSFLLIPATNLTRDVYQRIRPDIDDRSVLFISRMFVLVLGGVAILLVSQFETVLDAAFTAYNIYGASIAPALLAAFLWKRATLTGAVASIVLGAGVTILWTYGGLDTTSFHPFLQEPTFPAALMSIGGLVIGSLATPAPPKEVWGPFFDEGDSLS
jgi:SSS family solute:Na+ symporter/sodium/proline symporter